MIQRGLIGVQREDPTKPEIRALIGELDEYSSALYPAESNHFDSPETLSDPSVAFLIVRVAEDLAGCGAIKQCEGWGELKRMFVRPQFRGLGLAKVLLMALEQAAREREIQLLRLETGVHNHEALSLYRRWGFVEIGAFPPYGDDPLSVFMEKAIP